jgi:hypothetical protein
VDESDLSEILIPDKVSAVFGLHVIAYNLIRLGNLPRPAAMEAA